MKRRRPFPRIPGVAVLIVILALGVNALVFPPLQVRSADPYGLTWWILPIASCGVAYAALTLVPSALARRPRRALRLARAAEPADLSFLAVANTTPRGKVSVVTADQSALQISHPHKPPISVAWVECDRLEIVDGKEGSFIRLYRLGDSVDVSLYPLRDNGFDFMVPDALETLLTQLTSLSRSATATKD